MALAKYAEEIQEVIFERMAMREGEHGHHAKRSEAQMGQAGQNKKEANFTGRC